MYSNCKVKFLLFILLNGLLILSSAEGLARGKGSLKGAVLSKSTSEYLEFANIVLYHSQDSSIAAGTVSGEKGQFILKDIEIGKYFLRISFVGYKEKTIDNIFIESDKTAIDLGEIVLYLSSDIGEVEVISDRTSVVYKIDKKIVNIGPDLANSGGSAVDALENVPSVQTDLEGNVLLRGSESYTVLVNGKPSLFEGSEALQQIPVGTIESIEIITNPSAKYDASGSAGIINVITKRSRETGHSILANLKPGSFGTIKGDILYNLRTQKLNLYVGGNYGYSRIDGYGRSYIEFRDGDTTNYSLTEGDRPDWSIPAGVDIGLEYALNKNNSISVGAYKGWYTKDRSENMVNKTWSSDDLQNVIEVQNENSIRRYRDYYSVFGDYYHRFKKKGHRIIFSVLYKMGDAEESSKSWILDSNGSIGTGINTKENNTVEFWKAKIDYSLPLGDNKMLEAGYDTRTTTEKEHYHFETYDGLQGMFISDPAYFNNTDYLLTLHSLYSQFSGEQGKLGYQLGVRGEYTQRNFAHELADEDLYLDRMDLFPSLHLSFDLTESQQLLLSYSRRISRPSSGKLEPFETWLNLNFKKVGNPDLEPEYADSYELSWIKKFDGSWVSFETFFRKTSNDIDIVQQTLDESTLLYTYKNFGEKFFLGTELATDLDINKWWNLDCSGDFYYFNSQGEDLDYSREQQEYSWNLKMRNNFKAWKGSRLQLGTAYIGPSYIAQGRTEGYFMSFFVIRQVMLKNNLSITFRLHDLLQTGMQKFYRSGVGFYNENEFIREAPTYHITIAYRINRMKRPKDVEDKILDNMED